MQKMVQWFEVVLGGEGVALLLRLRRQVRALGKEDQLEVVWTISFFLQFWKKANSSSATSLWSLPYLFVITGLICAIQ
jgi:hypothetical protein